jgi:hypothetical protein
MIRWSLANCAIAIDGCHPAAIGCKFRINWCFYATAGQHKITGNFWGDL